MNETAANAKEPLPDWLPNRPEKLPSSVKSPAARAYQNTVLICGFAGAAGCALAWADYFFAVVTPFLKVTACAGLGLAAVCLAVFLALGRDASGKLPAAAEWKETFLISLAAMPLLVMSLTVLTNSWLDRSVPVILETLVTGRDDLRDGTERSSARRHTFRFHDSYIYLRAELPGGENLRLPGDYVSTRGLRPGDKYGVRLRKGFWGLAHVSIIR